MTEKIKLELNPILRYALLPLLAACAQAAGPASGLSLSQLKPGVSFQWQLTGAIDTRTSAQVVDLDLFDASPQTISQLKAQGKKLICYVSVGSWENWRPDASQFPKEVIGKDYAGWPGEKWLDIRQIDKLAPSLRARFDLCKQKGFDGLEPDNIDGYQANTGFPLSVADQLRFNRWIADEAHKRGLSIGLKNVPDLAAQLEPSFDWALTEDCFDQGWCEKLSGFVGKGKPVFMVEYTDTGVDFVAACQRAKALGFTAILKNRGLDAWKKDCN